MLYDQQDLYFGLDFNYCVEERNGYVCPIDIAKDRHTFRIRNANIELKGLEGAERDEKLCNTLGVKHALSLIKVMHKHFHQA